MLHPGDRAPDFTVLDDRRNTVSLADFRGRTLVLWFYPNADTPGCTCEGCGFRALRDAYQARNAAIAGVSFDDPDKNRAFSDKYGFNFPLLCDTSRQMGLAYGACVRPTDRFAARIGIVIDSDGHIKEYEPLVNVATYPADVLARL